MTSYFRALQCYGANLREWPAHLWPIALLGMLSRRGRAARRSALAEDAAWRRQLQSDGLSLAPGAAMQQRLSAIPGAHRQVAPPQRPVFLPVSMATAAAMVLGIVIGATDLTSSSSVFSDDYQAFASLDIAGSNDVADWLEGE
ncbi:hypothetical protein [Spongiibacter marinus]|uniref:hypothetical protein n=1 Tax=Spongiibacter marinus TaxID=354246 RepID=UPI0019601D78|nr:hypothetical protein [Spongiibacter marinus]MBM7424168.1 hypothetical protein [Spongiibacter marinus]